MTENVEARVEACERRMAASITQIQQSVEKKEGELMVYVSIVNTNVIKAQGDNKHQFSRAIQLAINVAKAHQELKRLIAAQRSQLQQAQDLAKELSKCHSRTLKNFGSKDEVQRLIDAELEMLKHRIEGMEKVEATSPPKLNKITHNQSVG